MRDRFTFFDSYWEAINGLPDKKQLKLFRAICEYALHDKEPDLQSVELSIFMLIKPYLDKSARLAQFGKAGGKPKGSQTKANAKPTQNNKKENKEGEIEEEIETEIEIESDKEGRKEEKEISSRAGARGAGLLPEGVSSVEDFYGAVPEAYREPKARIALMRATSCRTNGNEDEAQRWAALAAAGGLRVNMRTLIAP